MTEEDFLKRWSRRKQEAKTAETAPIAEPVVTPPAVEPVEPEIDLTTLPPIDSISAATDITTFLRKGIPAELSRAALRRAWAADPAIRDFVGLAENAWDFTDPNAMPGFGALQGTPEQIGAMVERVLGNVRETAENLLKEPAESGRSEHKPDRPEAISATDSEPAELAGPPQESAQPTQAIAATQPAPSEDDGEFLLTPRRSHGRALPS
jgi:hypothetical protein